MVKVGSKVRILSTKYSTAFGKIGYVVAFNGASYEISIGNLIWLFEEPDLEVIYDTLDEAFANQTRNPHKEAPKEELSAMLESINSNNLNIAWEDPKVNLNVATLAEWGEDLGKHYRYTYKNLKLDPYRVLSVYGITDPAIQHAIKKLLRCGKSVKDEKQDIQEVILTLNRKLEMMEEDNEC